MLHSIRWRLIFSYAALTLLTVLLVGIVALGLVSRYAAERERAALAVNASAVARQARGLLTPTPRPRGLQQLAMTAAFLTSTDIKILDAARNPLADSRILADEQEGQLPILPGAGSDASRVQAFPLRDRPSGPFVIVPRRRDDSHGPVHLQGVFVWREGAEHPYVLSIERQPGLWGDRLVIDSASGTPVPESLLSPEELSPPPLWRMVYGDPAQTTRQATREQTGPVRTVTLPIRQGEQIVGYVEISNRFPRFAEPLIAIRRSLLVAGAGALLLAVLLGFVMSRTLTAPLLALAGAARRMEAGNLAARAPETAGEIGAVARRFNRMAARLQATFDELAAERDALRRFIADASHELRTPLTALRQFVELLQGQAGQDPSTRAEFLAESGRQLDRLQWMTGHLLDLSRLDGGVAGLELAWQETAELLEAAVAPFRPRAEERDTSLRVAVEEGGEAIFGDRARLEMCLANLLDNALKFTPPGGAVRLRAQAALGATVLRVADSGPGIPPQERERIFERFYRGAGAEESVGAGLGLAIVKSIVEAHGGTVSLDSGPDGSTFILTLPRPDAPEQTPG